MMPKAWVHYPVVGAVAPALQPKREPSPTPAPARPSPSPVREKKKDPPRGPSPSASAAKHVETSVDYEASEHEALPDGSEHEPEAGGGAEKPAEPSFPLADAMFKALGEKLDAGDAERELFGQLEEKLWTGDWIDPQSGGSMKSPLAAKQRLERLLSKTNDVRRTYQARLADEGNISDKDFNRSLSEPETTLVHNSWMNDVSTWMNQECLDQYNELLSQANVASKSAGKPASSAGKGSAGKPASSAGKMAVLQSLFLQGNRLSS